jgi:phospholipid/cholesterol/gamma-HCH transport system substrate-binding protein
MQQSKNDFWVGLFVMLGAAALVFLALQSANLLQLNFQTGYRVTARFDNIGGLKPKAAVRSAGVVVGRVESITFDDKTFQARVTLELDKQYAFPKDSSLKILTSGCWASNTSASKRGLTKTIWRRVTTLRPHSLPWFWKT